MDKLSIFTPGILAGSRHIFGILLVFAMIMMSSFMTADYSYSSTHYHFFQRQTTTQEDDMGAGLKRARPC